MKRRVSPIEIFGLTPLREGLKQCMIGLRGDRWTPKSKFDRTSLSILRPKTALPLWLGKRGVSGRVIVSALPNRNPVSMAEGYSVRVTQMRDFRGRELGYDGHTGTDFAVPPGTEVVAAAPGVVVDVRCDMHRGGRKVIIDHGRGLMTSSNHLARALVQPGDVVARGQVVALSGMSSLDGILFFPWLAPHVHYTVTLNGAWADPFAVPGETPLWRAGNAPVPDDGGADDDAFEPTRWDEDAVGEMLASCTDPELAAHIGAIGGGDPQAQAPHLVIARLFYYHRFDAHPDLVAEPSPREPRLDLPFKGEDYDGVVFEDDLKGWPRWT